MNRNLSSASNVTTLRKIETIATQDKRDNKRVNFYKGEFPEAIIVFGGRSYKADVYDLSPAGASILPRDEIIGLDSVSQSVGIRFGKANIERTAVLRNISPIKFSGSLRLKLGFQLEETSVANVKSEHSFSCESHMPLAYCDDPIAFNRTMLFNVQYFSENGLGLRLHCEEGVLYPGLCLNLKVLLPIRGEQIIGVEIANVTQKNGVTELHCQFSEIENNVRSFISEFLLMTTPGLSIKELKDRGYAVSDIEKAFLFRSAQTPLQIERILDLRLRAAQKDGRWLGESDVSKMKDPWDKHARQIYCEVNSQIVGSARIVFNNGLVERSEHVSYGAQIPEWLWQEGFVECSRVCTDPDFRGAEVFFHILQQMSRIVTQAGYRYCVLNCVDSLVPVYKKLVGVFSLDQKFYTPFMKDRALNLLCVDLRALQVGINLMPTTWALNAPVGTYLVASGQIKLKWWEKILRTCFGFAHRLTIRIARSKTMHKKQKSV